MIDMVKVRQNGNDTIKLVRYIQWSWQNIVKKARK